MRWVVHDASLMAQTHQLTTTQRMADRILADHDHTLTSYLTDAAARGLSYEAIARELAQLTDGAVAVSYQTIKQWLARFVEASA